MPRLSSTYSLSCRSPATDSPTNVGCWVSAWKSGSRRCLALHHWCWTDSLCSRLSYWATQPRLTGCFLDDLKASWCARCPICLSFLGCRRLYIYIYQVGSKEFPWWIKLIAANPDRVQIVYDIMWQYETVWPWGNHRPMFASKSASPTSSGCCSKLLNSTIGSENRVPLNPIVNHPFHSFSLSNAWGIPWYTPWYQTHPIGLLRLAWAEVHPGWPVLGRSAAAAALNLSVLDAPLEFDDWSVKKITIHPQKSRSEESEGYNPIPMWSSMKFRNGPAVYLINQDILGGWD